MRNNIWLLIFAIFLGGCYEDKGNYDYSEVNVISVKEFQELSEEYWLTVGDELRLWPVLEYTLDSTVKTLKYKWELRSNPSSYKLLGTERMLKWVTDTAGFLEIVLTITDTSNGLQCIEETYAYVSAEDEYPNGLWQILYERDGKASLCAMQVYERRVPGTDEYVPSAEYVDHVYSLENGGEELGGKPYAIREVFADQESRSHLLLFQRGGIGPVYMDGSSYKKTILLEEEFVGKQLPGKEVFVNGIDLKYGSVVLTEKGDIYVKRKTDSEVFYTGIFPDFPAYYQGGMEITHIVEDRKYSFGSILLYDNRNHRVLAILDGGEYYDREEDEWKDDPNGAAIIPLYTEALAGFTPLNNMGDIEMVYLGLYSTQADEKNCWDVFKNNVDGKYYMQYFQYICYEKENKAVPIYQKTFPNQDILNGENKFVITPDEREFVFFSSTGASAKGGIQDKLYGYQFSRGTGTPKLLYDFNGKRITTMYAAGNHNYLLAVGLDSGEVYFFNIQDSKIFAGGTIEYFYKTEPMFGTVVDVIYAYGSLGYYP